MTGLAAGTALMPLKSLIGGKSTGKVIQQAKAQSDSQNSEDYTIFGNKVTGIVENEEHQFKLGGNIKNIYVEDGATVKVNGKEVTEQELTEIAEGNCIIGGESGTSDSGGDGDSNGETNEEHSHELPNEGPVTIHGITFQNVVDAEKDLNMDSNGNEPVDDKFQYTDNTLIKFPPGEYLWTETHDGFDIKNVGMIGTGESRTEVKFIPPENEAVNVLNIRSGKNFLMENLTFEQGPEPGGELGNTIHLEDGLEMHDLLHTGYNTNDYQPGAGTNFLKPYITTEEGEGKINNYDLLLDGVKWAEYQYINNPFYNGPGHLGSLEIRNMDVQNCGGFYMSRCEGTVKFINCTFDTSVRYAVRLGGEGNEVRNCKFIIDPASTKTEHKDFNMAMRWESGFQGFSGGLVTNTEIIVRSKGDRGVPVIEHEADLGELNVSNTTIKYEPDSGYPIIRSNKPGASGSIDGTPDKPWGLNLENVTITGSSSGDKVVEFVGRDGSTVRDCCISMQNRSEGLNFVDSSDCNVSDSNINVGGEAIIKDNSTVSENNIETNGTC